MQTYPIRKLKQLNYPRFMLFFDTETTQKPKDDKYQQHQFRLGVAIYIELNEKYEVVCREVYYFDTIAHFWLLVSKKAIPDRVLYIYAHNIKYDLMSVQFEKQIPLIGFEAAFPILGHNFIMNAKKDKAKIKFHDTFNYFKVRLSTLGKAVKQPKIKLKNNYQFRGLKHYAYPPILYPKFSHRTIYFNHIDNNTLYQYCRNDVEIIEKIMLGFIRFLRDENKGSLEATAASTSMSVFRTKFNDESIHYHKDYELLAFERSGYKGGRVECFYIGDKREQFYLFDVNSMYPYVMATCDLPVKPLVLADRMSINEALEYSENYYLIAQVILKYKSNIGYYGTHKDAKLLFPIGHFSTTLHNPELIRAIQENQIAAIGKTVVYQKKPALAEFAKYFHNIRLNSDNATYNTLAKLMNNSLYGRMGMSFYDKDVIELETEDNENPLGVVMMQSIQNGRKIWTPYYKWYGSLIHSTRDEFTPKKDTNIALAGAVTAYARMKLLDYIIQAGHRNAYYCDTDSILVNEKGASQLEKYIDKTQLGMLKQEMQCQHITINAPKDYTFGSKQKLKGVPSNYTERDGQYNFVRFTTLREYIKNGGEFYGTHDENKILTHNYNKGIILEDGFTQPIELREF